jgi:hypothetical protein
VCCSLMLSPLVVERGLHEGADVWGCDVRVLVVGLAAQSDGVSCRFG